MKRILYLFLFFIQLLACRHPSIQPIQTSAMPYASTFQIPSCSAIQLQQYALMSDIGKNVAPKTVRIEDAETIQQILSLLHQLPDEGDMMIKMGDVPVLEMILYTSVDSLVVVRYYNKSVKTPATSFYSSPPQAEQQLYDLLMGKF